MSELFDPGLQPERTELAWRRTALALGVGSIFAMRLIPVALENPWWALVGVGGLAATGAIWISARRRYCLMNDVLRREGVRARLPDAVPLFALAAFTLVVAALSILLVLVGQDL